MEVQTNKQTNQLQQNCFY